MTLAAEQTGGGIQPDPARARHIGLSPGVQIGKINIGAGWAIQCGHIRLELDEIAGDKTRGKAAMAQGLHQQPGGIAAGAGGQGQGFLRTLHARLQTHHIIDRLMHPPVQLNQKINGNKACARHLREKIRQEWRDRVRR